MTLREAMDRLESLGTAQNRKIYVRHGAGETFGVSFANLNKLKKAIKTDHRLATELWQTGNDDARILATMIADPRQATAEQLDAWVRDIRYYVLADMFSRLAAATPFVREKMRAWTKSGEDFVAQAGWDLLGHLAMSAPDLPDSFFEERLAVIERDIHGAKNRTRHAMNNALIGIGLRNEHLQAIAVGAAVRIGKVVVDHGQTGCKTPDAVVYIRKAAAHKTKSRKTAAGK